MRVIDELRKRTTGVAVFAALMAGVSAGGQAYAAGDANRVGCPAATESSPGFRMSLPDCRAYEAVSESNSDDTSNVIGSYGFPEGTHVYYKSFLPTPASGVGSGLPERFLATREPSGWVQRAISVPQGENLSHLGLAAQGNAEGVVFTRNFSEAFLDSPFPDPFEAPQLNQTTGMGVYKLSIASGAATMLSLPDSGTLTQEMLEGSRAYAGFAEVNDWGSFLVGGSADGSRAFFVTTAKLATASGTPKDTHEASNEIYERADGHTYLVGVLPDGDVPVCGAEVSQQARSTVGSQPSYSYGAIAPDGANVVFSSPAPFPLGAREPCGASGLYLRDVVNGKTVQLPGSVLGGRAGTGPGEEERIFTLGGGIHEYHVGTGQTTEVGEGNLLTYTPDGAQVYYLGPEQGIFRFEEGKPPTRIPGTEEGGYTFGNIGDGGEILTGPTEYSLTSNMPVSTPDGSDLLFIDTARLTKYDNCPEIAGEKVCHHEAYVYDAKTNKVTCISCNLLHRNPFSSELEPESQGQAQLIDLSLTDGGELQYQNPSPPFISNAGSRAVFETTEALVPPDVNGTEDVYEWEREGTEGCSTESLHLENLAENPAYSPMIEGCIYMLSSGLGEKVRNESIIDGTHLVGASENLHDVYVQTSESLLPGLDNASKLYDVRVEGGFPYPRPSHGCEVTQCERSSGESAVAGGSGTEAFTGPGNTRSGATVRGVRSSTSVRGRRLARALRVCKRIKHKRRRLRCVRAARRKYSDLVHGVRSRVGGGR